MKFCTKCGSELGEDQKFCTACGNGTQLKEPQVKKVSKLPLIILIGSAVALILLLVPIFLFFNNKTVIEPAIVGIENEEEPIKKKSNDKESLPQEIYITNVDTSSYPLVTVNITANNLETLNVNNTAVYDGNFASAVKLMQQTWSNGLESSYSIQYTAIVPDDIDTQVVKITYGDIDVVQEYEIPFEREDVSLTIHQIDTSNYPEISVFFTMLNESGEYVTSDKPQFFDLLEEDGGKSAVEVITSLRTTKDSSNINIALTLDRSDSMMNNNNFSNAQDMAAYFLDLLNFNKGDSAAVISFDSNVYLSHFFSADRLSLKNAVANMYPNGLTAFYDALHVALLETAGQSGAKCIVALTDGQDNMSSVSPNTVINKSLELGIPIYIIGLGEENFSDAQLIAQESGGYFTHIYDIYDIKAIYENLFYEQQQQMVVTYTVKNPSDDGAYQDVRLQFKDREYKGSTSTQFQYQNIINPNISQNELSVNIGNMNEIEKAIYYYEHQFVKAVNSYDFNDVSKYLDPNGSLYETQKNLLDNYKKRGVKERLLYYKINSLRQLDDGSYEAIVTEQFYIQIGYEKASYKEFKNTYIIRNTTDGYKISELPDLQTLDDRSVDIYLY